MVVMVSYLTFNYFVGAMGGFWGGFFNVDFSQPIGGTSGLTEIAGIKTIDTGIFGAIIISGLVTWIHNRTFEKQLPSYLGIFQGASYVAMISFFAPFLLNQVRLVCGCSLSLSAFLFQQVCITLFIPRSNLATL